jgi:TonB family protein
VIGPRAASLLKGSLCVSCEGSVAIERLARDSRKALAASFLLSTAVLAVLLAYLGFRLSSIAVPSEAPIEPPIEPIAAEIFEKPPEASHLVMPKDVPAPRSAPEYKVRPTTPDTPLPASAAHAAEDTANTAVPNVTSPTRPELATHGPVVAFGPSPQLPAYLRDQALHATVLIEFTVAEDGGATPRLVGPSGDEELDALALKAAKQWKFNPAVDANRPVPAKVRLRMNFDVK